jgi:3-methylcrotonyl-CoA carboxylase alpha subunit
MGARADTGVRQGDTISPWYDPMIAKIITHGATRDVALKQMERVLSRTQVAGSVTNLAFLRALTRHEGFAAGAVDTGLIERDLDVLAAEPVACSRARSLAALGALGLHEGDDALQGFALWQPLRQSAAVGYRGEVLEAEIETLAAGQFRVTVGDAVHLVQRDGPRWRIDGAPVAVNVVRHDQTLSVFWGNAYGFDLIDPLDVAAEAGAGAGVIEAPMPGLVKSVFVKPGQAVSLGDRLAILEAMKMEHTLSAGRDGVVEEVLVAAGAQVEAGAPLIKLEDEV